MIIKKLKLHNFGVYASTNEFAFKGKKPIVLIGGLNGRGKTTFLEAVLLALYGSNSFAYIESKYKSYGQYLRAYVNKEDNSHESYVELEFSMDDSDKEIYRVKRQWSASSVRTSEKLQVYKNGEYNQYLSDNWIMFIENILPSGLSNFFFFDGEKIAELAVGNTGNLMKEAIKTLLGISVLDLLESDIKRIITRLSKKHIKDSEVIEIEKLRTVRDKAAQQLLDMDKKISDLESQIEDINRKLEKTQQEYSAKGGDIVTQRQELFQKRAQLYAKIEQEKEILIADAGSELPLVLVRDLLYNIREKAEIEHDEKMLQSAIRKMKFVFDKFKEENSDKAEAASIFIDFFKKQSSNNKVEKIFNMSEMTLFQLQNLLDEKLTRTKNDVFYRQRQLATNEDKVDNLDNYLSIDIDENAIVQIYKEIKKLEKEKARLEVELELLRSERRSLNGEAIATNSEFNKMVEAYLAKVELNDDGDRVLKYSHIAINILKEYKIRLQKKKTEEVAETMTACYKKLANKKNLIDRIIMDPLTLDITYLNVKGEEVSKVSLSAGEKQLMVISILWALAICSKKKFPLIIDTPLSRLDSSHRISLIQKYFPYASEQTIILSTDSEIDRYYYEIMKENIGDEFTLYYDDISRSTTIKEGYFWEDKQ